MKTGLFPKKCIACGKIFETRCLCEKCRANLSRFYGSLPGIAGYTGGAVAFNYLGGIRRAIIRYKFRRRWGNAGVFADLLAETAEKAFGRDFDAVTWVPVSFRRRMVRGCDQSEILARRLAERWSIPCRKIVEKTVHNPPQSSLKTLEERQANVRGVYRVTEKVNGMTLLLIDDILTTGATMTECRSTLLKAGAAAVECVVLAYAGLK